MDEARRRGVPVRADQYAYSAASSTLGIRFPAWVLEGGGARIRQRLEDASLWPRIRTEMLGLLAERGFEDLSFAVVASYKTDPGFNGKSIKQLAGARKGTDSPDAQMEVAREMLRAGGASMVYHLMSEQDIETILRHPQVMVASDSSVLEPNGEMPHPRGYGNNPRVLGRYVRQRQVIPLEEAIRKMTSLPAEQFGFRDRGLLQEGKAADLVVFDPAAMDDPATYERPHQYATGVVHVFVNGVAVIRDGKLTNAFPGQILKPQRH
jgi:N-acyl-D-amino-acid deacylase